MISKESMYKSKYAREIKAFEEKGDKSKPCRIGPYVWNPGVRTSSGVKFGHWSKSELEEV